MNTPEGTLSQEALTIHYNALPFIQLSSFSPYMCRWRTVYPILPIGSNIVYNWVLTVYSSENIIDPRPNIWKVRTERKAQYQSCLLLQHHGQHHPQSDEVCSRLLKETELRKPPFALHSLCYYGKRQVNKEDAFNESPTAAIMAVETCFPIFRFSSIGFS